MLASLLWWEGKLEAELVASSFTPPFSLLIFGDRPSSTLRSCSRSIVRGSRGTLRLWKGPMRLSGKRAKLTGRSKTETPLMMDHAETGIPEEEDIPPKMRRDGTKQVGGCCMILRFRKKHLYLEGSCTTRRPPDQPPLASFTSRIISSTGATGVLHYRQGQVRNESGFS